MYEMVILSKGFIFKFSRTFSLCSWLSSNAVMFKLKSTDYLKNAGNSNSSNVKRCGKIENLQIENKKCGKLEFPFKKCGKFNVKNTGNFKLHLFTVKSAGNFRFSKLKNREIPN